MAKNTGKIVGITILILAVILAVVFAFGTQQTQFTSSDRYVEIPVFASVECSQSGSAKTITGDIPIDGRWISDFLPSNTNGWNILLDGGSGISGKRFEYYVCPSRNFCNNRKIVEFSSSGGQANLGLISSDDHVWVQYQTNTVTGWKGFDKGSYRVSYFPFILIRDDPFRGGRQEIQNEAGCTLPTSDPSWLKRITSFEGSSDVDTWTGNNELNPGQFYNYITTNIVSVTEGNLQSGGWCLFENGRANVYEIERIRTGDGNLYNRVNLDNRIAQDECCEGEFSPSGLLCIDGELETIEVDEDTGETNIQCQDRGDCGTLELFETGDKEVGRFECIQNQCTIVDIQEVDCTDDSDCRTNERCNRNTYTCEIASTVTDDPGESRVDSEIEACLEKAEDQPLLGWTFVAETTEVGIGPLGIGRLIGLTKEKQVGECKASLLPWYIFGGIIILILIVLAIYFLIINNNGGKK